MMHRALIAADQLEKYDIRVEVIDPRTLVPFDWELVEKSVRKTGRVVTVFEGPQRGGIGSEIAAELVERTNARLKAAPRRVASPNTPTPFAPIMENYYRPSVDRICEAVRAVMSEGRIE